MAAAEVVTAGTALATYAASLILMYQYCLQWLILTSFVLHFP